MTFKVLPKGERSQEGPHSSRSGILWWSYHLLYYPSLQRATSNFNIFIDLFVFCWYFCWKREQHSFKNCSKESKIA